MKAYISTLLILSSAAGAEVSIKAVPMPDPSPGFVWQSEIPEDCPFEQSPLYDRIYFTGKHSNYWVGDTIYPSWASDGNLYTPWTDGSTAGVKCGSYPTTGKDPQTGHAIMTGEDPLKLTIKNTSPPKEASALPYFGRYPCGSLVHNGVWYYGTYCLEKQKHNGVTYCYPVMGSMPGFQISHDLGKTWEPSPHTPLKPLFPEPREVYLPVKMGAPHFVDFGKNMEHSPDGKAYLIAQGAEENDPMPRPCLALGTPGKEAVKIVDCPGNEIEPCSDYEPYHKQFNHANLSWITADQTYLARVTPSPETINDEDAYEYFGGHDKDGNPIWTDDFNKIKPLIEWNNNMGCVTATYFPKLKKYIMCITDGWPTMIEMSSYILEADEITGPWRIVTYMKDFGTQAYFLNFPSKFIRDDGSMWLSYSANFRPAFNDVLLKFNPPGGRYGLCLHEMRFLSPDEKDPVEPDRNPADVLTDNIASEATITVSSQKHEWFKANEKLADGIVDGQPNHLQTEWVSSKEQAGAWCKFEWDEEQAIDRIILADRPVERDQVLSGILIFSDGSHIMVDQPLPNDATDGLEISFPAKKVKWVKFEVLKTKQGGWNIGLSEVAIFKALAPHGKSSGTK